MFYVYIVYSVKTQKFYKGQCSDVNARLERHNSGLEKSTRYGSPWILLWLTKKETRSDAMTLEKKLKNLSVSKTIKFIQKYNEGLDIPALINYLRRS